MPRRIFKNLVIAAAGPLPGQLTVDSLRQWTTIRKGVFTEEFDEHVTHLLCTREQFNQKLPRIKEALARGKQQHIVHCDWFEISAVNDKKQPERDYSMRNILAKQNAAKRELARIEKGKREGERAINTNLFHIYIDREFFSYQIDINRDDDEKGELGQRYTLYLWESNAKPHLYWFTAKFMKKKGDSQPSFHRPSPCSGPWRREMDLFIDFFRIKTGIEWQDRVLGQKTMPNSFFQYSPPTGGKPVGRQEAVEVNDEEAAEAKNEEVSEAKDEEVVEAKDENAVTELQSEAMDVCAHDTIPLDESYLESNSQSPSESSVKDDDEESRVSRDEIETEEYAMSQEVEDVEEVPEQPQSDVILESPE
ncbi:hypothetical protein ACHAPX_006129 [Trichoderma viride]